MLSIAVGPLVAERPPPGTQTCVSFMQRGIAGSRVIQTLPTGGKLIQDIHPVRSSRSAVESITARRSSPLPLQPIPNAIPLTSRVRSLYPPHRIWS